DKWPCCSGTFPQLTADYGISAYYQSRDGVYVNLFLPSRLSWMQNNTQCSLTQMTEYPRAATTQLSLNLARPESFTLYVRIPAWAGAKTTVSVNGRGAESSVEPGKFLALQRSWKDGDRIEIEFEMPLRLEAIDNENPNNVALLHGPIALFAVDNLSAKLKREDLLSATALSSSSSDWVAKTAGGLLTLRPFSSIMSEGYRLYNRVES
ncbi:MAG TPA: hypothetical protein VN517_04145, partial [Terriglobales bacterium]|nr:hypothetical protein [Terriglobales bacterium]